MHARMHELTALLHAASRAYYHENREIMTDREYDALYDELAALEAKSGTVLANSPTRKVGYGETGSPFEVVTTLRKVPHALPMLSLDKTKSIDTLAAFLQTDDLPDAVGLLTWKMDGLALSLTYENGTLVQALTRGNGAIGEDVTHNARVFSNLPLTVPHKGRFTVRGEAIITYDDFAAINARLPAEENYKNPRNLCSGSVRQLNSEVAAARNIRFYAIGLASDADMLPARFKSSQLTWLTTQGFEIVPNALVKSATVPAAVEAFKQQITAAQIATDGLVLTFDDIAYGTSLGTTSKFPRDAIAFKWADETAETTLRTIEWNTSRTGLINPIAVFDPVELEGTTVTRASLHNVSIVRQLQLHPGDRIRVYKANMIIPQVAENLSRPASHSPAIPVACPVCAATTEIVTGPSGESLYCPDTNCAAQRIRALAHFVSRNAMNIDGLSEQTLEKFIAIGAVQDYPDLFYLQNHEAALLAMEGFGQKSYDNLLAAIDRARHVAPANFIYALGIRHVGLANAKLLCAHFAHDIPTIIAACAVDNFEETLNEVKGFGAAISTALHAYFADPENTARVLSLLPHLHLQIPQIIDTTLLPLHGLTFVITGEVTQHKNRKALQSVIEAQGGKVTSAVTAKTSYLINNNAASTSGKNKKAAELGVAVITEAGFEALLAGGS
ncbi:MAG: NAD-dependent DNA ligase LigA [Defluviitaleaceae bacterium]|nr:NAD-dependent DNA ligase LigA [Defluviitaleaceae bacterium]